MTKINNQVTPPKIDLNQRHKEVVIDQIKQPTPQIKPQTNTFTQGPLAQAPTGTQTIARQGVQRAAPTQTAIPTQQAPQMTQMQNVIQGGGLVRRGSRGPEVSELQTQLNNAGIQPPLAVDGQFGPLTQQAVRDFQAQKGIAVDGLVGPQTLGCLGGSHAPTQPRPVDRPNAPVQPNAPGQPNTPNAPGQPNAPTTPGAGGPADARIGRVAGMENTTPEFRQKVADIADRLGMNPQHLMAVMSFETGGSFSPSERNRVSGATGLIQFMPSTARGLGTSTQALSQMDPMRQLDYVEKYLQPYAGKMNSVEDAYMAVLWPAAVGKGPGHSLFSNPSIQYRQNRGLDLDGNGVVTAREAANKVRARILG